MPQDPLEHIGGWMCQLSFISIIVKKIVYPRRLSIPGSTTVFGCSGIPQNSIIYNL